MNTVERVFSDLIGEPCWSVGLGALQGNLTANFGDPHLKIREPKSKLTKDPALKDPMTRRRVIARGRWWLCTLLGGWSIQQGGELLARGFESEERAIHTATVRLSGQRLTGVEHDSSAARTTLEFDLGGRLILYPIVDQLDAEAHSALDYPDDRLYDARLWALYLPESHILAARGSGEFWLGPRGTPYDSMEWTRDAPP